MRRRNGVYFPDYTVDFDPESDSIYCYAIKENGNTLALCKDSYEANNICKMLVASSLVQLDVSEVRRLFGSKDE